MNGEAVALQPCMSTTQTDEAWHVLDGELTFRYADRTERVGPGTTVFVPAGMPHTYSAGADARYLIILTPRIETLISALQADRDPAHQHDIYRRFGSELLE
jgi:quercetin dioxygenase-like cupin family protein